MAQTPVAPERRGGSVAPRRPQRPAPDTNPYYERVARHFRHAKHFTLLVLILFLLASFTFNRSEITIENLQYMMKFISFTNTETSITAPRITYSSSDDTSLGLFIGDLCYLSPQGYWLYDSRGNTIMTESIKYASPELHISEKFTLCYDMGGYSFSIFNTYSKLYSETTEYPVWDADIADDGSFAVASSSRQYRTQVTLYDSDFKPVSRVLKDKYLMDVQCKADGSEVAIMTISTKDGAYYTTIDLVTPGEETARKVCELDGLGYSLFYTDGGFAVITDERICFLDEELTLRGAAELDSSLAMADCAGKYLTCIFKSGVVGNSYTAVIYDVSGSAQRGKTVYQGEFDGKLAAVSHDESGDYIFILMGQTLWRVNLYNKKIGSTALESSGFDVLPQSADSFLLATQNYALTYTPEDWNEEYYDRNTSETTEVS
ncbi:MAG: hypothetical protein IJ493_12615 [Clostridia bacterium]|nr:hypothetical protein [Clostridia bacterium]